MSRSVHIMNLQSKKFGIKKRLMLINASIFIPFCNQSHFVLTSTNIFPIFPVLNLGFLIDDGSCVKGVSGLLAAN